MSRFLSVCLISLTSLFAYTNVLAQDTGTVTTQTVVERPVIVTAVPAPKETISTPLGYMNCFTVKAGWYKDVWVADHSVCQYANNPSGDVWIEGYWMCNKYDLTEAKCTNWEWKAARWEKALVVY